MFIPLPMLDHFGSVQLWRRRLFVNDVLLLANPDITVLGVFMIDGDKEKLAGAAAFLLDAQYLRGANRR
ncbi:hypothetical protein D3C75_1091190 [compost metagenome]